MESLVSERRKMLKRWKYLKKYHNEVIAEFENYVDEKDYEELMDICSYIDEFYIEIKSKKSRINLDILQRQSDSIRAELDGSIIGVSSANDNVYNLNPAFNIKIGRAYV